MSPWRKKGSRLTGGGKTNLGYLNIFVLLLVLFFNLADQIYKQQSFFDRIEYTLPFAIFATLLYVFRKFRYTNAIVYFIIAIGTTMGSPSISDFSGAIFFVFSFHLIREKYYSIIIAGATITSITARAISFEDTISGAFIMVCVYFFVYAIYYFLIYKDSAKPTHTKIKDLSAEENAILKDMVADLSQKESIARMCYTTSQGYDIIRTIKKKTGKKHIHSITYEMGLLDGSKTRS